MTHNWPICRLGEIAESISTGPFGSMLHKSDYVSDGIPLVNPTNMSDSRIVPSRQMMISSETRHRLSNYTLRAGDVVVARRGEMGRCALVTDKEDGWLCGTGSCFVRLSTSVDPRFFVMLFGSERFKEILEQSAVGTTMSSLNHGILKSLPVPVPPLPEQRRIVAMLDEAFDGIAELKTKAETNLQNARTIFESQLQAIFTRRGEGWMETSLGEVYDVRDGTHDSPKYHDIGFPLVTSKNLKREGVSFDDVKLINELDYNKINERSAVHKGDVLFAMIGTIGNPTLVTIEPRFAIKNVALFKIPKGQCGAFLKHYLASSAVTSKMMKEAKGTTQRFVGLGYLRKFPISIPPLARQLTIVAHLDELSDKTQRLESLYRRKLAALDDLKKSLIHHAFTGQL